LANSLNREALPKISVITPSFNQGHFIEETITSVINQNYPNLEYIIMDGGSQDNTIEIIKKYESTFASWKSEKDNGQSDAINQGLRKATGDVFNWLNSDDYYEKSSLQHVAQKMSSQHITCYIGKSRIFNKEITRYSTGTDLYPDNLYKTIGWARIDQPETFFRYSVFAEIGYLNECLHYVMDKDLWIRYLSRYGMNGIEKDSQLLVNFRLHESSKSVSLRENFEQETRNLFYTYAIYFNMAHYCKLFESLWNVKKLPLTYYPYSPNRDAWNSIFNYFIFQQGLEEYALNNYKGSNRLLFNVQKELLDKDDINELKKVQLRLKYLPKSFKKIFNKLSHRSH
jgi:glycosyltransferase involved in cell wall biosynthesis